MVLIAPMPNGSTNNSILRMLFILPVGACIDMPTDTIAARDRIAIAIAATPTELPPSMCPTGAAHSPCDEEAFAETMRS